MDIIAQVLEGNRLALSRLLTLIENDLPDGRSALDELFLHTGKAYIIGITGPTGSGKSTLVNHLALELAHPSGKSESQSVAIVAVDPSSPFTGGALLGDRVRMRDLMEHPEIFIRSMATRGALGGLARATNEIILALDAGGFNVILVETVGAGQSEVDIARLAHTTIVVEAPGLGDDIQAAKAGILEIADILVVNKADKSGADSAARSLSAMLKIGEESALDLKNSNNTSWNVPVLKTSALYREGIEKLADTIQQHHQYLLESKEWERRSRSRIRDMLERLLRERLFSDWVNLQQNNGYEDLIERVYHRQISPHQALQRFFS